MVKPQRKRDSSLCSEQAPQSQWNSMVVEIASLRSQ
jgi:hypothetical protein